MQEAPKRGQGDGPALDGGEGALYPLIRCPAIFSGTMRFSRIFTAAALVVVAACPSPDTTQQAVDAMASINAPPEHLPVMLNKELPFRYPDSLFASKVQANVTLGIFIDTAGMVWPESTRVLQSSGYAAFDSVAKRGAPLLQFQPATTKGKAVAVTIKLPVFFRYPGARPLPGDSVLAPKAAPMRTP